jgi:transposase
LSDSLSPERFGGWAKLGWDEQTGELFSYVNLEKRVRSDHPLRAIRGLVNEALGALEQELAALYIPIGRPSIPPEKLLRAMLLQAFYSIRSERQLMERLEFDLLFRWFVGIDVDDAAWDHSVFFQEPRAPFWKATSRPSC